MSFLTKGNTDIKARIKRWASAYKIVCLGKRPLRLLYAFVFPLLLLSFINACTVTSYNASIDKASDDAALDASQPAEQAASSTQAQYQFTDLPVPIELSIIKDSTMLIHTPTYQGGIVSYKGNISSDTLEAFFVETLPNHGWQFQGSLHGKNIFLAFSKGEGAQCLIKISQESFYTLVEIWLSEPIGEILPRQQIQE